MPRRVLIIDDSLTSRTVQQAIVQEAGFDVSTAQDATEGMQKVRAERPDLVLLDVMMPGVDGFTACRALRDHRDTQHLPIILVTSQRQEGSVETGFACGCSDYVLKPIDRDELLAKIENFLPSQPAPGRGRKGGKRA